jgi:hypothetical protein
MLHVARQFLRDIVRGKIVMQYADEYQRFGPSILQKHTPRVLARFSRPVSGFLSTNKSLALPYRARPTMHWCETRTAMQSRVLHYYWRTGDIRNMRRRPPGLHVHELLPPSVVLGCEQHILIALQASRNIPRPRIVNC